LKLTDIDPGERIRCPKCKTPFTVPAEEEEPEVAEAMTRRAKTGPVRKARPPADDEERNKTPLPSKKIRRPEETEEDEDSPQLRKAGRGGHQEDEDEPEEQSSRKPARRHEEEDEEEEQPKARKARYCDEEEDEEEEQPRSKKRHGPDDEEEEEEQDEDRPRKKKQERRKNAKGNPVLLWSLIGGGALLLIGGVILFIVLQGGNKNETGKGNKKETSEKDKAKGTDSNKPEWTPDETLLKQLAPEVTELGFRIRPPEGFKRIGPISQASGAKVIAWSGTPRGDNTAPVVTLTTGPLKPNEVNMKLDEMLEEGIKESKQGGLADMRADKGEIGQINGLSFIRASWTAKLQGKKVHGFLYVTKEGKNGTAIIGMDFDPHHGEQLKLLEAAARTIKKQ
jgi:hypothetical protein